MHEPAAYQFLASQQPATTLRLIYLDPESQPQEALIALTEHCHTSEALHRVRVGLAELLRHADRELLAMRRCLGGLEHEVEPPAMPDGNPVSTETVVPFARVRRAA